MAQGTVTGIKAYDKNTSIEIDGTKYSIFNNNLPTAPNVGDTVEYEYTENGKYKNLKYIKAVASGGSKPQQASQDDRQLLFSFACCISKYKF